MSQTKEIRVCLDIGSTSHRVLIALSNGNILEEFNMPHTSDGIYQFFQRVEAAAQQHRLPVAVAMEAFNGHARPLDHYILSKNYRLLSINNHKLARFKEIFPAAAKSDVIDSRKMLELFSLKETLPLARNVLQEVHEVPITNQKLKRLTRRRELLIEERTQLSNRLYSDLNSIAPGLTTLTKKIANKWFLNFLSSRKAFKQLLKIKPESLLKIPGIGKRYLNIINTWQKQAILSPELDWVGDMVIRDAKRILELQQEIDKLEEQLKSLCQESDIAQRLITIPGLGIITAATLAGEIGIFHRFSKEASLALYLGMSPLENSSGKYRGTKLSKHINKRTKRVLMVAAARHIQLVPQAKQYYIRKRAEGKKHNQAVRSLGRHLIRVIWSLLRYNKDYSLQN